VRRSSRPRTLRVWQEASVRRSWALVVAVLFAALIPSARALPPDRARSSFDPFVGGRTSPAEYVRAGFPKVDAAELGLVSSFVAGGVPARTFGLTAHVLAPSVPCGTLSYSAESGAGGDIEPAGDLDGDHGPDVIEQHVVPVTKTTRRWEGSGREARTGKVQWSRSLVLQAHQGAFMVPEGVGPLHRPGALLVRYEISEDDTATVSTTYLTVRLEGLDGRGRTLWRHTTSGSYRFQVANFSSYWDGYPFALLLGRFRPGADDLLIQRYDSKGTTVTSHVERVAVESGAVSHPYPTTSSSAGTDLVGQVKDLVFGSDSLPSLWVVPDQNGDRRNDVLLTQASFGAATAVYRGDTGAPVWSNSVLPLNGSVTVYDAGVITQGESRIHDLALVTFPPVFLGVAVPALGDRTDGVVLLLQGGHGTLQWALPGTGVQTMHRYGGTPAIGVTSSASSLAPNLSTQLTLEVDVVDGLGLVQAVNTYSVAQDSAACEVAFIAVVNTDDFNADGVPDAHLRFDVVSPLAVEEKWITVQGANGNELDRVPALTLGGAVDGRGVDRGRLAWGVRDVTLTVVRGDAVTKQLLRTTLPAVGSVRFADVVAEPAVATHCEDVLATSITDQSTHLRLLAGNGRAWWTLSASRTEPSGKVTVGHGAHALC
jgi:hypothetical protein